MIEGPHLSERPRMGELAGSVPSAPSPDDRRRAGLKDVARLAGVSVKTVSNVVNDYEHVTPKTRARVEQAIKELNYRPNLSARNLRKGRSGIIALAVPELDIPYFAELARLIVTAAEERGLTVLIDQTGGNREREQLVAEGIRDHLIDGLIFSPLALTADDLVKYCEAIASASGGILGIIGKISAEERALLKSLASELTTRGKAEG